MTSNELRKIVLDCVGKYKPILRLTEWDLDIEFHKVPSEFGPATGATTDVDISYLRATLKFFPVMKGLTKEDIEHTTVHELCHIITEPMYSLCRANVNPHLQPFVEEQREQETERIARIVLSK